MKTPFQLVVMPNFTFLVCIIWGSSLATLAETSNHSEQEITINRPLDKQVGTRLGSPSEDFYRFGMAFDSPNGGLGRCSVTFVDTTHLKVDLSSLGAGADSEACLGLTAKHCLDDLSRSLGEQMLRGRDTSKLMCTGTKAIGVKADIDISFPGEHRRQALLITSSDLDSKEDSIGLIALPCPPSIKRFRLNDDEALNLTQLEIAYPMSNKTNGVPVYAKAQRTAEVNGASTVKKNGKVSFNQGRVPIGGDSGSPGFIKGKGGEKILAGVISGEGNPGVEMVVGNHTRSSKEQYPPQAQANLKKDVEEMLSGLTCGGNVELKSDSKSNLPEKQKQSESDEPKQKGFSEFKPGATPSQKAEAESKGASETSTANGRQNPLSNQLSNQFEASSQSDGKGREKSMREPSTKSEPTEPTADIQMYNDEVRKEIDPINNIQFKVGDYVFLKDHAGNLVRIGPNGERAIPRLLETLNGKRDLVYLREPKAANPYERASRQEREAFRVYYTSLKADRESWNKMSEPSKKMIEGFLNGF